MPLMSVIMSVPLAVAKVSLSRTMFNSMTKSAGSAGLATKPGAKRVVLVGSMRRLNSRRELMSVVAEARRVSVPLLGVAAA